MNKTARFCHQVFFVLFLLLIFLILLISAKSIVGYGHFIVSVLSLGLILGIFYILMALPKEKTSWYYPVIAVTLGTLCKLFCLMLLGDSMEMKYDYLTALESAQGVFAEKELIYVHWAVYPRILSFFFTIFGSGYTQAVLFNILTSAFSTWLVYLVARRALKCDRAAFIAALIFALWPSFNFYHLITSNEHLAIFFALLSVYLLQLAIDSNNWKQYMFFTLCGLVLGVVDFFKQFSIIFFIAFTLSAIIWNFIHASAFERKKLAAGIVGFVIMVGIVVGCKQVIFTGLDQYYGQKVCRSANAHFLYMGLNSTGNGVWNDEVGFDFVNLIDEYDRDYDKASEELFNILKKDIDENKQKLLVTIKNKLVVDWSADGGVVDWVKWLYKGGSESMPGVNLLYVISGSYYFAAMLLIAAAGIFSFIKKNFYILLLALITFGFALVLVLTEAQGRYQLVLFPWFSILAAYGGSELYKWIHEKYALKKQP